MCSAPITLLTDFGSTDGFVGIMKGVICGINPRVRIIDLAHDVAPGDIDAAAFILASASAFFPDMTIHVIVVDPGVGSERRAIAVRTNHAYYVAPDNGVLKYIYPREEHEVIHLTEREYFLREMSRTFHGRDVFAPVAAHLSAGVAFETLGEPIRDPQRGDLRTPRKRKEKIRGEIIHIDRFGNLVTNIAEELLTEDEIIRIDIAGAHLDRLSQSYSATRIGDPLAIFGSHGYLEIAVRNGSAAKNMGVTVGETITLTTRIFDQ